MSQTIPVRTGEELDQDSIKQFILTHIDVCQDSNLFIRQFPSGKSNLTYVIKMGDWEAVLRRPPFGPLPPKAHDMKREYELLNNLHPAFPLAPKPYVFCEDQDVIGSSFYLMELKQGNTINDELILGKNMTLEDKRRISYLLVDAMVDLHSVDYQQANLEKLGYPIGFLERTLKNWIKRYDKYKTEDIHVIGNLINWLETNIPQSQAPTLIHNDFKLNNVLLSENTTHLNGILDWEMATIGDPLFDLGATLSYWIEEGDPETVKESLPTTTAQPGFISRREFLESYAKKTGRDVSSFPFYIVLAYFKIAVTQQQIYYRFKSGNTNDSRFALFGKSVRNLMTHADHLTMSNIL